MYYTISFDDLRNLDVRTFSGGNPAHFRSQQVEMLAADAVIHDGPTDGIGPEGFYPFFDRLRSAFPDLRVKVEDTIVENDLVCMRWRATMTHMGEGLGMAPTGKKLETTGISIVRIAGGRLVEGWQNWDMLGLMRQIQATEGATVYYVRRWLDRLTRLSETHFLGSWA